MQENTNKAIAVNSIYNYARMGINTILALLTTRYALQALGIRDFGLYSVLGSIIVFIGIFNTIMLSTCNRFMAVAIGKNVDYEINRQFNINLVIFIGLAILMLIIAFPIGIYYINSHINYDGPIENAIMVFSISIIGSIISTIATPYSGLLLAKERFLVFSVIDVITHIVRFVIALLLVFINNKLLIYTITMAAMTALPTFVYPRYCKKHFGDYVRWNLVKDMKAYKEVFSFSGWVSYGAFAFVARNQGAALLVNSFFTTIMNTALGIANSLNAYVTMFANSVTQPMQPQITKSYASGNYQRTDELLIMSTKFSFLLMLLISCPFFCGGEWILKIWLGEVPPYALAFTTLLIVDNLVMSFNSGISVLLFASGKIALYQMLINTLRLMAIFAAYFVLNNGAAPEFLFYTYIVFSLLVVLSTQWCLHHTLNYDNKKLLLKSYLPSISVLLLFLPITFISTIIHPIINIIISLIYLLCLEFFLGLSRKEKLLIISKIK